MNNKIVVLDRISKKKFVEEVYGGKFIEAFYGNGPLSSFLNRFVLPFLAELPFFSRCYGFLQKTSLSKAKVKPFIQKYGLDEKEFLLPAASFASFNDFFIRRLKTEARPVAYAEDVAVLPADGRYLLYPNVKQADGFVVKGKKFTLEELLQDKDLAGKYSEGAMLIARLCPTDYHRFHFPVACVPSETLELKGPLHSVNPFALRKRIEILSHNKRAITFLESSRFGKLIFIEVGATCVGSIHQTFNPGALYEKGAEKGYFSFGGSSLIVLFEPGSIAFDPDLVEASEEKLEVLGLMGQSLGKSIRS